MPYVRQNREQNLLSLFFLFAVVAARYRCHGWVCLPHRAAVDIAVIVNGRKVDLSVMPGTFEKSRFETNLPHRYKATSCLTDNENNNNDDKACHGAASSQRKIPSRFELTTTIIIGRLELIEMFECRQGTSDEA